MRDATWSRLAVVWWVVAGLSAGGPSAAAAVERRPAGPPRGWVVDRARFEVATPGSLLHAPGTGEVRGVLDVVPSGRGVALVNELGLDDYLQGVAEVPSAWPGEALRAQAIAARTFALHHMARAGGPAGGTEADICPTQACQRYVGVAKERQEHGARWVEAVRATSGQVLLDRGEPILAQYSSSNGGRSVAGGRPYLRAVNDPDSARGPYGRWTVRLGYGPLGSALGLPGPLVSLRRTGDAVALDWAVPDGPAGQTVVPVPAFRERLNEVLAPQGDLPSTVPSPQFDVLADDQAQTATLEGRGHGHGIGMSQFGALAKANRGMRAGDILASYYGGLRPVTLPPDRLPPAIRVSLGTGRSMAVRGDGRFRVLDGAGAPLAVAASGAWRVVPAGRGRVRVVPPPDQEAAPAVDALEASGPGAPGTPGEARFRLASAALVRVRVEGGGLGAPVETPPALVEPGAAAVALPELPAPGTYAVTVLADAGAGRVTSLVAPLRVRAPEGARRASWAAAARRPRVGPAPAVLASGLLLGVVAVVAGTTGAGARVAAGLRRRRAR